MEKAIKLQDILEKNPEVVSFLRLLKDTREQTIVLPVKADKLIGQKEASQILGVSATRICEYVKKGWLVPYYTPPASSRKFWLSDVMGLPKKGSA